jgi:hypothetical protein
MVQGDITMKTYISGGIPIFAAVFIVSAVLLSSQLSVRAQEFEPQIAVVFCESGGWAFVEPEMPTETDSCTAEIDLIRTTEVERLHAMVEADMEVVYRLHADNFQLINPGGLALSNEEYLGYVASGDVDYLEWEPVSDIEVHLYGNAAVIQYQGHIDIRVFGSRSSIQTWHTDSYEKRNGQWQVVWSQATAIE